MWDRGREGGRRAAKGRGGSFTSRQVNESSYEQKKEEATGQREEKCDRLERLKRLEGRREGEGKGHKLADLFRDGDGSMGEREERREGIAFPYKETGDREEG